MKALSGLAGAAAALALITIIAVAKGQADEVWPGIDLFKTPLPDECPSSVFLSVPADFFAPGSDPIQRWVLLQGQPLETVPSGAAGTADTIVRRVDPTSGLVCGAVADTVDIVVLALQLAATSPIEVTFGGMSPQLWNLKICAADPPAVQPTGTMTIRHECQEGGTFDSALKVIADAVFTPQAGGPAKRLDGVELELNAFDTPWRHDDPAMIATTRTDPFSVDGDCDGLQEPVPMPGTSNFVAGLKTTPCGCPGDGTVLGGLCNTERKVRPPGGAIHSVVPDPYDPDPDDQPVDDTRIVGDHFLCYKAKDKTIPHQDPDIVRLLDQFDEADFNPGRAKLFCTPVEVSDSGGGGFLIQDEDVHLKIYKLRSVVSRSLEGNPRHPPFRVTTRDRLYEGFLKLTSDKRFELMVPTSKGLDLFPEPPPDAPVPGVHYVDHFKCYNARIDSEVSPSFPPDAQLDVRDQFRDVTPVKIRKPRKLCVPVDKNEEGRIDPVHHLTCYRVRLKREEAGTVQATNQFGSELLKLRAPKLLCLQSRKTTIP